MGSSGELSTFPSIAHADTAFSPWRMNTPITSWPCSIKRCAATLESTPPDMANTTRDTLNPFKTTSEQFPLKTPTIAGKMKAT
jgi:hypothetical protein